MLVHRQTYLIAFLAAVVTMACGDSSLPSESSSGPPERSGIASAVAAFGVNSTVDAVDIAPGNGVCRTAAGTCTLRAAIQESNALAGANTINLSAGTYALTILPRWGKDDASGSLAITGPLRIHGAGTSSTVVDGAPYRAAQRTQVLIKVVSTAGSVTLSSLTLLNGGNATGLCGGSNLRVEAGATVVLRKVAVRDGWESCSAGGIRNAGTLTLDQSVVTGSASAGVGGGISNGGTLTIGRSTISANWAEDDVGGIANRGQLTMTNSTLSGNSSAYGATGGLSNSGTAVLNNVTVTKNGADGAVGPSTAVYTLGGAVTTIRNTIIGGNFGTNCTGTLTSGGYNLIGGIAGCTVVGDATGNVVGVAPRLGPLQSNGGPTPTHALLSGSPARNAGNPATPGSSLNACPTGDQRLLPRSSTRCDIGSVEMQ